MWVLLLNWLQGPSDRKWLASITHEEQQNDKVRVRMNPLQLLHVLLKVGCPELDVGLTFSAAHKRGTFFPPWKKLGSEWGDARDSVLESAAKDRQGASPT